MLASVMCLVGAILSLPAARGVTLECTRDKPGAVPACEVDEPGVLFFGGTTKHFAGRADAFSAAEKTVGGETPVTSVHVEEWRSRPLAADRAYATAIACETFVRTPDVTSFERRMPATGLSLVLTGIFFMVGTALALSGARRFERSTSIIIDAEVDELVVETRWLRSPPAVLTLPLSKIEAVDVERVENTGAYQLWITTDGTRQPLVRAGESGCEGAAALIRATAKIS